jgi:two-component system sensor histidine kinase TctE
MSRPQSLRNLLLHRLTWPLVLVVVLDVALTYFVALHFANLAYDRWLMDSARSLAQEVKPYHDKVTFELPPIAVEVFRWDAVDKTFFKIESRVGGFVAGDRALPIPSMNELSMAQPLFSDRVMQNEKVRVVSVLMTPANSGNEVMISVAETLRKRQGMTNEIILAVALPQFLLVFVTLFHVWSGIKRGLQPLADLTRSIDDRSARDLTPIPDTDVPLEVRSLTHTLNALMERLGASMTTQRRFIENAAHQLRTPLAGLKLQAELAARSEKLDTLKPALIHIKSAADRVAHLSSQLLVLAHSEVSMQGGRALHPIDLVSLARETCLEWAARALEQGMDLAFDAPQTPVEVTGDGTLLRELLNNLLDNALRYGRKSGHIVVEIAIHPSTRLRIRDDGPGLSPAESERVLERFYRVPGSPGDGCGLGLAIVKEIADLHQARLRIMANDLGSGLCVEIQFPSGAEALIAAV